MSLTQHYDNWKLLKLFESVTYTKKIWRPQSQKEQGLNLPKSKSAQATQSQYLHTDVSSSLLPVPPSPSGSIHTPTACSKVISDSSCFSSPEPCKRHCRNGACPDLNGMLRMVWARSAKVQGCDAWMDLDRLINKAWSEEAWRAEFCSFIDSLHSSKIDLRADYGEYQQTLNSTYPCCMKQHKLRRIDNLIATKALPLGLGPLENINAAQTPLTQMSITNQVYN